MKNFSITIAAACFLFMNSSCKKDALPDADGTTLWKTVKQEINGTVYDEKIFEYNSDGKFIGFKNQLNEFTFDGQNRMIKYRDLIFEHNSIGQISKRHIPGRAPNNIAIENSYTYDTKGRLIADTARYTPGALFTYRKYNYDTQDNIVSSQYFIFNNSTAQFEAEPETKYSYDGHPNPYRDLGLTLYLITEVSDKTYLSKDAWSTSTSAGPSTLRSYTYYNNGFLRTVFEDSHHQDYTTTFYYK